MNGWLISALLALATAGALIGRVRRGRRRPEVWA